MLKQLVIYIFFALHGEWGQAEEECTLIDDLKRLKIQVRQNFLKLRDVID